VPVAVIGMARRNAPAYGADTAVRRATAAWFGAVASKTAEAAATIGKSQSFRLASNGGAAAVLFFCSSQAAMKWISCCFTIACRRLGKVFRHRFFELMMDDMKAGRTIWDTVLIDAKPAGSHWQRGL
jgi:hypothetical protein